MSTPDNKKNDSDDWWCFVDCKIYLLIIIGLFCCCSCCLSSCGSTNIMTIIGLILSINDFFTLKTNPLKECLVTAMGSASQA